MCISIEPIFVNLCFFHLCKKYFSYHSWELKLVSVFFDFFGGFFYDFIPLGNSTYLPLWRIVYEFLFRLITVPIVQSCSTYSYKHEGSDEIHDDFL